MRALCVRKRARFHAHTLYAQCWHSGGIGDSQAYHQPFHSSSRVGFPQENNFQYFMYRVWIAVFKPTFAKKQINYGKIEREIIIKDVGNIDQHGYVDQEQMLF